MKKLLFLLPFIPLYLYGEGPKIPRHKDPSIQLEFENVYQDLRSIRVDSSTSVTPGSTNYAQINPASQQAGGINVESALISHSTETTITVTRQIRMNGVSGSAAVPLFLFGTGLAGIYGDSAGNINLADNGVAYGSLGSVQWFAPNGSASEPAYSFNSDSNTGFYTQGNDSTAFTSGGIKRVEFTNSIVRFFSSIDMQGGELKPVGAANANLGTAADYWNDVSYKTLTDRGCLGWFDDGVKMRDGKTVNDLEVFSLIKKHPSKKTVYGAPMLDYTSFPEVAYKKATYTDETTKEEKEIPRDENDEPFYWEVTDSSGTVTRHYTDKKPQRDAIKKLAADGVEMTAMQSIMIGALKEANARIKALEERVSILEGKKGK